MPTTVRFSDELETHSRIGLLWATLKRLPPLRGDQAPVSTHIFGGRGIQIAFACDDNYASHVAVAIRSILSNAGSNDSHKFHILSTKLGSCSKQRLKESAENGGANVSFHFLAPERLSHIPSSKYTLNTYIRLFIAELLKGERRIIYLDCDVLIKSSLHDLWGTYLEGMTVAACPDASCFDGSSRNHIQSLELSPDVTYFNAGVMLIDLEKWQINRILENSLRWISMHSDKIVYADQDVLNVVLKSSIFKLDLRWNVQTQISEFVCYNSQYATNEMVDAVASPAIIHFTGANKPWMREYPIPFQKDYFRYRAETPWANDILFPMTIHHRIKRLRRQLKHAWRWMCTR